MNTDMPDGKEDRQSSPALRRRDLIGWALTAYTALSGMILWYAIFRGELSGILDTPMPPLSPALIACPLGVLLCITTILGRGTALLVGCLPLFGWSLHRRGFRSGTILLKAILWLTLTLGPAAIYFAVTDAVQNAHPSAMLLLLTQVLIPLLLLIVVESGPTAPADSPAEENADDRPVSPTT